jgi:hypothetical protein
MRIALLLFGLLPLLQNQPPAADKPVSDTVNPTDATPAFHVEGRGDQIYLCAQTPTAMQWVLKGPAAVLYDAANQQVGKHGDGPTWTWKDGSAIMGKVVGKHAAPDSGNVPWLLIKTGRTAGPTDAFAQPGVLDPITYVQRSNTQGGIAPTTGCDAAHIGASQAVKYSATYTFYKPGV